MDFFEQMEARIPHGEVRTRFAPSPTGYMHVGNLRTALYTYLQARHNGGTFILRIEDTDQGRLVEGATDIIYGTLKATGLTWDEATFTDYIKDPKVKIPGTKMVFAGIKNDKEIGDLTAFLKQFGKDGKKQ